MKKKYLALVAMSALLFSGLVYATPTLSAPPDKIVCDVKRNNHPDFCTLPDGEELKYFHQNAQIGSGTYQFNSAPAQSIDVTGITYRYVNVSDPSDVIQINTLLGTQAAYQMPGQQWQVQHKIYYSCNAAPEACQFTNLPFNKK